jgi:hypothetical protein
MKRIIAVILSIAMLLLGTACGAQTPDKKDAVKTAKAETVKTTESNAKETAPIKIKITAKDKTVTAVMENNVTVQAFVKKLPVTLPMQNLYSREMCYHYGSGSLPTDKLRSDGYQVGDIIYWPPRGSFVILYVQNGELFERQHMGRTKDNVDFFRNAGDVDVTFELLKE